MTTPQERFRALVVPESNGSGCLTWIGARSRVGYGQFRLHGKTRVAHRGSERAHAATLLRAVALLTEQRTFSARGER